MGSYFFEDGLYPFSGKTGNFSKFREITENLENSGKCRNSVKNAKSGNRGWAPKRAPDPAPLGAPCYYKTVG